MGNNLFTVLTTLLSILIAIVTCISAIYIAYKQRKIGKQAHLNNLSVEFVTDFIGPFDDCRKQMDAIYDALNGIKDSKERVRFVGDLLGKYSLNTVFLFWEQHKGDVEDALRRSESKEDTKHKYLNIVTFVNESRKFKSDINNMQKVMSLFLENKDIGEYLKKHDFSSEDIKATSEALFRKMEEVIAELPEELEIQKKLSEIRR